MVEEYSEKQIVRLTHKTITDPEKFRRHLLKIRKQASVCQDEITLASTPSGAIFNHKNEPAGSVVVMGFSKDQM